MGDARCEMWFYASAPRAAFPVPGSGSERWVGGLLDVLDEMQVQIVLYLRYPYLMGEG